MPRLQCITPLFRRLPLFAISFLLSCNSTKQVVQQQYPPRPPQDGGREYWVVFQKNFRDSMTDDRSQALKPADSLQLELSILSASNATGMVEIPGIGFRTRFTVAAGSVITVPIPPAAQLRSSEKVEKLGVHVTSDQPVTVYGLNRRFQTTDTYLATPVTALGKTYRAACYRWLQNDLLSQLAVVAVDENTTVTITPTVRTSKGRAAMQPFTVTLARGEAYQVIPKFDPNPITLSDLTGTLVESDKPIALFSGHNCAYVPDPSIKACNLLVEQMPPIATWGTDYYVGMLNGRSSSVVRVLASSDSTVVMENGRQVAALMAGKFYENNSQKIPLHITANNPVLVTQLAKGFDNSDNIGDPMMIVIAPLEQYSLSYRFATPVRGSWRHYINLSSPAGSIGSLRLDGAPIDTSLFKRIDSSEYLIGQLEVKYGAHEITGRDPFGFYSYGFGYDDAAYDAYGNAGSYLLPLKEMRNDP